MNKKCLVFEIDNLAKIMISIRLLTHWEECVKKKIHFFLNYVLDN